MIKRKAEFLEEESSKFQRINVLRDQILADNYKNQRKLTEIQQILNKSSFRIRRRFDFLLFKVLSELQDVGDLLGPAVDRELVNSHAQEKRIREAKKNDRRIQKVIQEQQEKRKSKKKTKK